MSQEQTTKAVNEEVNTEATLEPVQLTLQDLQSLANIIDVSCRRGAFKGDDMQTVGATYSKLTGFLAYVTQAQEIADKAEAEAKANAEQE